MEGDDRPVRDAAPGGWTIESDAYDRATIARLRAGSEAWRRLDEEGSRLLPRFPALLDDLFCALFKANVLPAPGGTPPGSELAARIVAGVVASEAWSALRHHSVLDETRAGLGAVSIGESVLRALREDRTLTSGDLLDLWKLGEKDEVAREAEEIADVAEELAREEEAGNDAEESESGLPERPTADVEAARRAALAARSAARGAAAEREQKRRRVEASLDRVAERLDRGLRRAAAEAATRVADLPEALAAWGGGLGAGGGHDPGRAIDLGRRLADDRRMRRLAQLFGRMRESALALRRRVFEQADQELHDVRPARGLDDLARLVPAELVSLRHPLLRRDFHRRLLDGGLAAWSLRGEDARGRGPMVVCLDVSSSMAGEKELWAKAVTLTFVELARRRRRRCHAICFSSGDEGLRRFDLNPGRAWEVSLDRALDLAAHFPGGGTDWEPPLEAAMQILADREMRRGDLVLVTDGECETSEAFRDRFLREKRRRGFALHAILIDVAGGRDETLRAIADRVSRVTDLAA
ncbi:MAG: vWA domain-containing protein, partial [Alphaproteobacteria bacterium]